MSRCPSKGAKALPSTNRELRAVPFVDQIRAELAFAKAGGLTTLVDWLRSGGPVSRAGWKAAHKRMFRGRQSSPETKLLLGLYATIETHPACAAYSTLTLNGESHDLNSDT